MSYEETNSSVYFKIQELLLTEASTDYLISASWLEDIRFYSAQFFQVNIGLESHLQLIISIALLLLANSQTNTITGLEVLFENESSMSFNGGERLDLTRDSRASEERSQIL